MKESERPLPYMYLFIFIVWVHVIHSPHPFFLNQIETLAEHWSKVIVPNSGKGLFAALKDTSSRKRLIIIIIFLLRS